MRKRWEDILAGEEKSFVEWKRDQIKTLTAERANPGDNAIFFYSLLMQAWSLDEILS